MNQGYNRTSPFHQAPSRRGRGGRGRGGGRPQRRYPTTQQTVTTQQRKQQRKQQRDQEREQFKNDVSQFRYAGTQTPVKKNNRRSYKNVANNSNSNSNLNSQNRHNNNTNNNHKSNTNLASKQPKFKPSTDGISSQLLGYESDDEVFNVNIKVPIDNNNNINDNDNDSKMESEISVTTSNKNKNKSKKSNKKYNTQSNIERRGLLFDRATRSWYDKKDKYYQVKKLLNGIATNINNHKDPCSPFTPPKSRSDLNSGLSLKFTFNTIFADILMNLQIKVNFEQFFF